MIVYLDTSMVLRVVLHQPRPLAEWDTWERAYASELLGVEARRTVDRLRLEGHLEDAGVVAAQQALARVEGTLGCVRLTRAVLHRASMPMGTVVKTLDALHLATALLLRERHGLDLTFATHDARQATAARALGFECIGVGRG
jgi:predicted nucleic acid-binding protein